MTWGGLTWGGFTYCSLCTDGARKIACDGEQEGKHFGVGKCWGIKIIGGEVNISLGECIFWGKILNGLILSWSKKFGGSKLFLGLFF